MFLCSRCEKYTSSVLYLELEIWKRTGGEDTRTQRPVTPPNVGHTRLV